MTRLGSGSIFLLKIVKILVIAKYLILHSFWVFVFVLNVVIRSGKNDTKMVHLCSGSMLIFGSIFFRVFFKFNSSNQVFGLGLSQFTENSTRMEHLNGITFSGRVYKRDSILVEISVN